MKRNRVKQLLYDLEHVHDYKAGFFDGMIIMAVLCGMAAILGKGISFLLR